MMNLPEGQSYFGKNIKAARTALVDLQLIIFYTDTYIRAQIVEIPVLTY